VAGLAHAFGCALASVLVPYSSQNRPEERDVIKLSAWLGLALAALLVFTKINHDHGVSQGWPFLFYDYLAPALLAIGAIVVLRGGPGLWLAAGWGFNLATTYVGFFDHAGLSIQTRPDLSFAGNLSIPAGALLIVNLIGLVLVLLSPGEAHGKH
jgi:hypothetical protein